MEIIRREYSIFYDNGVRKSKGEYLGNIKDGAYKEYYTSGNTKYRGFYKNDKKDGEWEIYSETGEIVKIILYKDGNILEEEIYSEKIMILDE